MTEQSMPWTSGVGDGGPYSQDTMRMWGKILGVANGADIGIVPSQLNLLAPSSSGSNNITADTGYAIVDGTLYENDASEGLTVTSPSGGTTGARLSLRKTWATRQIRLTAIKNTDGNAAIPALVQVDGTTWDIPIATFKIATNGVISELTDVREFTREAVIPFSFDGGGGVIATGVKYSAQFKIPFACHLIGWEVVANASGSIVVDFWKDTYANYPPTNADSITASDPPTLSGATKNQNLNASTWTQAFSKGDIILPNVDSVTTVEQVVVFLRVAIL